MGVTGGEMRMMLRYEVKRTWRSPLPWLLLCAAAAIWVAALVLAGEEGTGRWQASALVQHRHLVGYLPVFLTLLSAYLVWETQRDRRSATEQVFLAWPVASWRWALVRTLALGSVTMASWLVLTALQAAYALYSYAGVAGLAGGLGAGQMLGDIGIMATDLLASLLGAQATAQVVAAVVPGIGGLVLVILYRLFILVGPGMVMGTFQWPYILLVTPELGSPWPQRWWPYSGAFGLAPYESLFWAHRALWIGGSTAALVCLAVLYRKGRDQPAVRSPLWASAALAAVILCAAPFVAEGKAVKDAFSRVVAEFGEETKPQMVVDENGHVRSGRPWEEVDVSAGPDDPLPVRYEIEADLTQGPEGRFHVQMEVEKAAKVMGGRAVAVPCADGGGTESTGGGNAADTAAGFPGGVSGGGRNCGAHGGRRAIRGPVADSAGLGAGVGAAGYSGADIQRPHPRLAVE